MYKKKLSTKIGYISEYKILPNVCFLSRVNEEILSTYFIHNKVLQLQGLVFQQHVFNRY